MKKQETMTPAMAKDTQARRNMRLGLILGAVALAIFFGYILRAWLLGP